MFQKARKNAGYMLAAAGLLSTGLALPVHAESLADAIALAYQSNPTLLSERAQVRVLNESYMQARSGYGPQASVSSEFDYSQTPTATNVPGAYEQGIESASASLLLTQPIYTGGLVTAEVRAAMAGIFSERQKLRQTEATVLQSVVQAYVDVRRDEEALRITKDNLKVLKGELDETQARFDVGQVPHTDVAVAEARYDQAEALLANAVGQLTISRATYVAVVGQSPADLAPEPPLTGVPSTLDQAFTDADRDNAGILAADFAERAAAARVAVAKAANRPTVSLRAGYGASATIQAPPALRIGPLGAFEKDISASAVFTQPLFTSGLNSSRIREALETDNVQRIAVETARRQAVQAVSQAWSQLLSAQIGVRSYGKQVESDKLAYEGIRQEALAGTRTTTEVLNAEQELLVAELALLNAKHDLYVATASLLSAVGRLEVRYMTPGAATYDPKKYFNKVRGIDLVPSDYIGSMIDQLGSPRIADAPARKPMVVASPVAPAEAGSVVLP